MIRISFKGTFITNYKRTWVTEKKEVREVGVCIKEVLEILSTKRIPS